MIWERESDFDSVYMDVFMCTTNKGYMPTDQDYEASGLFAAETTGKLPLIWGGVKKN